jgi:N-hydroxyarylamine O-acetyltransferase
MITGVPLDSAKITAYLGRLGVQPEYPSAAALARLHAAHVERIPFETLDRPDGVDPRRSLTRIVEEHRGGVCYQLSGAFKLLLEELGYQVTAHAAGVQSGFNPSPVGPIGSHVMLTARGLPSPENQGGSWILDVGVGEGFTEPLPLCPGTYPQGDFVYTVKPTSTGWRVDYDRRESCRGVDFAQEPAQMEDFAQIYDQMADGEMSLFFRFGWVKRHHRAGFDQVIGSRYSSVTAGGRVSRTIETPAEYLRLLSEVFSLDFPALSDVELVAMWKRFRAKWTDDAFRAALAAKPPKSAKE